LKKNINTKLLIESFSAKMTRASTRQTVSEDTDKDAVQELKLIDSNRAQNFSIVLSRFRLNIDDIKSSIHTNDSDNILRCEVVEQLLKFIPTKEEIETLNQYSEEVHRMTKADKFFFEIAQIPRYEEKLKAIHYRKTFEERLQLAQYQIDSISDASIELTKSKAIEKIFLIILALGNYMNKGARGNSPGFKLNSLSKLRDTKSADGQQTLLHYLAEHLDTKFKNPTIEELQSQTRTISNARTIDAKELRSDVKKMRDGIQQASAEVQASLTEGREVPTLSAFCSSAEPRLAELTNALQKMDSTLQSTARHFGENPKTVESHELFSIFDSFFHALEEARSENEKRKLKIKEEEQQIRITRERKERISTASKTKNFDEMGELLRKGELFDHPERRRKKQRKT